MKTWQSILGFNPEKHSVRTEFIAGVTTFLTMSYILAVNPDILAAAGMDKGAVFTATALSSAVATLLIAFLAKLPFAQAPSIFLADCTGRRLCGGDHLHPADGIQYP